MSPYDIDRYDNEAEDEDAAEERAAREAEYAEWALLPASGYIDLDHPRGA